MAISHAGSLYVVAITAALVAMTACSGGSSGERTPATLAVTSVHANVAVESGATLSGLSKIAVGATGTDASRIGVSFDAEQAPPLPLVRDLAKLGQF